MVEAYAIVIAFTSAVLRGYEYTGKACGVCLAERYAWYGENVCMLVIGMHADCKQYSLCNTAVCKQSEGLFPQWML